MQINCILTTQHIDKRPSSVVNNDPCPSKSDLHRSKHVLHAAFLINRDKTP